MSQENKFDVEPMEEKATLDVEEEHNNIPPKKKENKEDKDIKTINQDLTKEGGNTLFDSKVEFTKKELLDDFKNDEKKESDSSLTETKDNRNHTNNAKEVPKEKKEKDISNTNKAAISPTANKDNIEEQNNEVAVVVETSKTNQKKDNEWESDVSFKDDDISFKPNMLESSLSNKSSLINKKVTMRSLLQFLVL